ncbi:hypothetical protein EBB07_28765 [Paenibacillaceae bacterium]|nr:hypothetical protein EBB07_28765 [Paenibacillaceae bacterium]
MNICEEHGRLRCSECAYIKELKETIDDLKRDIQKALNAQSQWDAYHILQVAVLKHSVTEDACLNDATRITEASTGWPTALDEIERLNGRVLMLERSLEMSDEVKNQLRKQNYYLKDHVKFLREVEEYPTLEYHMDDEGSLHHIKPKKGCKT